MRYYIHKETNEPMASFAELLDPVTGDNIEGYPNQIVRSGGCYTRVVFPNKWIGNGVLFHIIHYRDLKKFKRISKEKFFELCPDFGQFRHFGDNTIDRRELLFDGVTKRKLTFGK